MWYFAWILGTGFACTIAILWGMWHELRSESENKISKKA